MKKISLLLAALLIALFAIFALGSGEETTVDQGAGSASQGESSNIGKYSVTIDSCRLAEDYTGNPVVIVKYTFKNVQDDNPVAFFTAFDDNV